MAPSKRVKAVSKQVNKEQRAAAKELGVKSSDKNTKKKPKTYKGKSTKPGGGGRFAQLTDKLQKQGKSAGEAKAIAAMAGRKKYGAKKMSGWAKKGRARKK